MNSSETRFRLTLGYLCFSGKRKISHESKETRYLAIAPDPLAGDHGVLDYFVDLGTV
jgi:hypothetical protein